MTKLTTLSCIACSGDSPLATPEEIETLRLQVPEWNILISEGVGKLSRVFEFSDFIQALEFSSNEKLLDFQINFEIYLENNFNWVFLLRATKFIYVILPLILIIGFLYL